MATGLDYRGKAYVFPEYYHPTAWVGRKAVEFLKEYKSLKPFMSKVSFHRPHSPYNRVLITLTLLICHYFILVITGILAMP